MLHTTKLFILAAVLIVAGVSAASAQMDPQSRLTTAVPFSFVIEGKTYPAGNYTFARLDANGGDSSQIIMRGSKGESIILDTVPTVSTSAASDTHLIFEKVAGQYFLKQIWAKGDTEGSQLIKSKAEKEAIAASASGTSSESTSSADRN
jgi:hypothetical protein